MALKIQVSHRHQTHHLYPVFLQSSVTNLPIPKLAFDNAEQVLYPRTNARLLAIPLALLATEVSTLRFALVIYLPAQAQCTRSPLVAVAGITRITKDDFIIVSEQSRELIDVRFIGGSHGHRMGGATVHIRSHMNFHPEIPLLAFAGLMHLGVSLAFFIRLFAIHGVKP